jgi:HlyD family secretion protein
VTRGGAGLRALAALALAAGCHRAASEPVLAEVGRDDLVVGVEVTGVLAAVDSTDVKPPALTNVWNFKIASMAPEGQEVKPGDPVIAFDASEQARELENMRNEADAAQKKLDKKRDDTQLALRDDELKIAEAEAGLRRAGLKTDAPPDLIASIQAREVQLDEQAARLTLDAARQHAEQVQRSSAEEIQRLTDKASYARQRVAELEKAIAKMQVTAERAGTIVYAVGDENGEKRKVGDNVWRMADVMSIVGLGQMTGDGQVDEVDMARLADHQPVVLRLDALPDVQLRGAVQSIARSVSVKSQTDPSKIVKLKISIDATANATKVPLRPGMRFRGQVETEHLRSVVQVPADAVFVTGDGPVAYRKAGGGFERVRLELGRRTATRIEVKSGLQPGDQVSRSDPGAVL